MRNKKHKKHHKSDKWENYAQEAGSSGEVAVAPPREKPLKLVLKVASVPSPAGMAEDSSQPPAADNSPEHLSKKAKKKKKKKSYDRKHKHHHHHHKEHHEKKEKRKAEDFEDLDLEPPPKMPHLEEPQPQRLRDPRSCTLRKRAAKSPLQLTLSYLLKNVEKKDNQQFFAWPVSDVIAPGYSSIISHPMDLSTIRKKIDSFEYFTIMDFRNDVKLMCDNAMTYNRPDTVYFKAAKKLWHFSSRLLSKEQLQSMRRQLPCMADLTLEEMGLESHEFHENSNPASEEDRKTGGEGGTGGEDSGDEEAQEVLAQARQAARAAADRLSLQRPGSRLGFLRQDPLGATTLAILHPSPSETPVPSLEALTGRLAQGSANIMGFKEDPKNLAKPVSYLSYGPFSSYAPYYDSMFSNLTKEESDLILSTYGDDVGMQYAESILNFANSCDYMVDMVDNLLDVLTNGEHSKTAKIMEERKQMKEEEEKIKKMLAEKAEPPTDPFQDIDLSMLEKGGKEDPPLSPRHRDLQERLDHTGQMLTDLARLQHTRLSAEPPTHLSHISGPTESESDLANQVSQKLVSISSEVTPSSIVTIEGVRKALGISYHQQQHQARLQQAPPPPCSPTPDSTPYLTTTSEIDLNEFLETGPMLRVCDSPTAFSN